MFVESRSIEEALGKTTSTDKLEVEMLPHMAEGHVGVLVDDSTIRTEGELPAPCLDGERLPHEGIRDGGSYIARTTCPDLHGTPMVGGLLGSVHLGLGRPTVPPGGTFGAPHEYTEGSSPSQW